MNNLLVGNLAASVSEKDIRSLFEPYGLVHRSRLITDRATGISKGFGFVQMRIDADAEEAALALNGTNLNGQVLTVSQARLQILRRTEEQ